MKMYKIKHTFRNSNVRFMRQIISLSYQTFTLFGIEELKGIIRYPADYRYANELCTVFLEYTCPEEVIPVLEALWGVNGFHEVNIIESN